MRDREFQRRRQMVIRGILMEGEPKDQREIVETLKEKGIPIARRTVAKYRNELNILPSNLRKKY